MTVPFHTPTRMYEGPVSPYSHQHLLFSVFLTKTILVGEKMVVHCGLIHISLMTSDVEHFCVFLLCICICSLKKCMFKFFAHFIIVSFVVEF